MKKVIATNQAPAAIGPYSQAIRSGDMPFASGQPGTDPATTTCFLADMGDFAAMNAVYEQQFTGSFPARSAFAVKTLPKNGLVEIEVIAVRS